MKSCPHCQFLVPDGAENCSVCKQPIAIPSQPAGPWGVDPGPGFGGTPPLPGSQGGPQQPASSFVVAAPPKRSGGAGKVFAIVAVCLVGVVVFGVAGLAFLGTTSSPGDIDAAAVKWQPFVDPNGAYSVEMPGTPVDITEDLAEAPIAAGASMRGVMADNRSFGSAVIAYTLPAGMQLDLNAAVDGAAASAFSESTVTARNPVQTPLGPAVDAEVVGKLSGDGEPGIAFVRVLLVGPTPYAMFTFAPTSSSPEASDIQQRMVSSFTSPPAA